MMMQSISERSQEWLLASMVTAVAWGVAVILIFTANQLVSETAVVAVRWLSLLGGGVVIGVGQWLFLQPDVKRGLDWLLVCSFGWAAAMFLMLQLITFTGSASVQIFVAILLGLGFGLVQQAATHLTLYQARHWLFTSSSQWGLTWFITFLTLAEPLDIQTANEMATIWLAGWGLLSILTTLCLILIFPQALGKTAEHFSEEWLTRPKKSPQRPEDTEETE
jgi:hypothetical protein